MKWIKCTIDTHADAVDMVSAALADVGVDGVEIEDNVPLSEADTKGMFIDILPELPPDDNSAKVSFYLDAEADNSEILANVSACLEELSAYSDIGERTISYSVMDDQDWQNNWKAYFHPFSIGDILIKPTWEEVPDCCDDSVVIEIDPGMAFGTGSHETTMLCIEALQKYIKPGDRVIDIGTGSGILSIAAIKLGAAFVFATDVDPEAVRTAAENVQVNGISDEVFKAAVGDITSDETLADMAGTGYDIAVANILAPVIISLAGEAFRHLKHGGVFITSGILDTKEEDVKDAFEACPEWDIKETARMNDWVSVVAVRR